MGERCVRDSLIYSVINFNNCGSIGYHSAMITRHALWHYVEAEGICPGVDPLDVWLDGPWITIRVGRHMVPILPTWGLRNALTMHDVHHLVTGYDTSVKGEAELAAWELGSGGCGFNLFFWIDRVILILLALPFMPFAMYRSFRLGLGRRNLYTAPRDTVLAEDIDQVRRRMRFPVGNAAG